MKRIIWILLTLGVLLGLLGGPSLRNWLWPPPAPPTAGEVSHPTPIGLPVLSPAEIRQKALALSKPHLAWADRECQRAVTDHVEALDRFFLQARKNTPAFAKEALGWGSKWRLLTDHLPLVGTSGRHAAFLREAFARHLFAPQDLEVEVRQIVRSYLETVKGVEGLMLVKIRQDVADLPASLPVGQLDQAKLKNLIDKAVAQAADHAGASLRDDAVQQLIGLIVGEVLAQAAVRLGVSAGVVGVGVTSSWATLGVGLIVGLIVDEIIGWVWDWLADPRGELARKVAARLDELHRAVVQGTPDAPGLRPRLEAFARERAAARPAAVLDLITQEGER